MKKNQIISVILIVILLSSMIGLVFAQDDEPEVLPPEYQWQTEENPWDELSEDEKIVRSTGDYYLIKMEKLSIHYPTQNIDIDFMYRKTSLYHENNENTFLQVNEQFDLIIWYYDKEGNYYASYIRIPDFSYGEGAELSYSDVFFEDDDKILCWNCSYEGVFIRGPDKQVQNGEDEAGDTLVEYKLDYKFRVINYDNESLLLETDTFIKFQYITENINKTGNNLPITKDVSIVYLYILHDVFNGFSRLTPEIDEKETTSWYQAGDYDVSAIVTADKAMLTLSNGTENTINIKKEMKVLQDDENYQESDPNYGSYTLFNATFENIPFNNSQGNVTELYYDPIVFEYYETRITFIFALILLPCAITSMVIIAKKKKNRIESGDKLNDRES
ncbi:MAG: hypothetical protein ACTSR8_08870 [Promethearchaeota archaeon]